MNNIQKNQVVSFRAQGLGYLKISKLLSLPVSTIKSYCQRNGIQTQNAQDPSFEGSYYCKNCGKELTQTPHHRKKVFCSDSCRLSWWAMHPEKRNRKALYSYTCPQCHKTFEVYGNRNRVFCSHSCYMRNRNSGGLHAKVS